MKRYDCERAEHRGGTRLGVRVAVGVCHLCGVGLCAEHGERVGDQPLLCSGCSRVQGKRAAGDQVTAHLAR